MPLVFYKGKTTFYDRSIGVCCAPATIIDLTDEQARLLTTTFPELFQEVKPEQPEPQTDAQQQTESPKPETDAQQQPEPPKPQTDAQQQTEPVNSPNTSEHTPPQPARFVPKGWRKK